MSLHIAVIQPKCELVDIAAKVLVADLMVDAVYAALQDCPNAFDAVGADVIACVFASTMIDGFMLVQESTDSGITAMFVSMQSRTGLYVVMNFRVQRFSASAGNRLRKCAHLAHASP